MTPVITPVSIPTTPLQWLSQLICQLGSSACIL